MSCIAGMLRPLRAGLDDGPGEAAYDVVLATGWDEGTDSATGGVCMASRCTLEEALWHAIGAARDALAGDRMGEAVITTSDGRRFRPELDN
jgi:hypothetical protein